MLAEKIVEIIKRDIRLVLIGEDGCPACGEAIDYTCKVKDGCIDALGASISKLVFDAMAAGDISVQPAIQQIVNTEPTCT